MSSSSTSKRTSAGALKPKRRSTSATPQAGKRTSRSGGGHSARSKSPRSTSSSTKPPRRSTRLASSKTEEAVTNQASLLSALLLASLACFLVYSLFQLSPKLDLPECRKVGGLGWFFKGAVFNGKQTAYNLSECVLKYDEVHPSWTLVMYIAVYLLLQAFAIPGPLILSLLSGALWPLWKAQIVIAFCATTGASLCYTLSKTLKVGEIITSINKPRADQFRDRVLEAEESGNLLYFMLFLRISPLLPNWFVNLVSPVAGVPLRTFAIATALGLVPANIIHYQTGKQLHELVVQSKEANTTKNMAILFTLQFVALLPTLLKKQFQKKLKV